MAARAGGWLGEAVADADRLFHEAMDDDFNTARAIGHLFDLSRAVNRGLDEGAGAEASGAAVAMLRLGSVLGLFWKAPGVESWPAEVLGLAEARVAARKAKNWAESDRLRDELKALGVAVEDSAAGQKLKKA